MKLVTLILLGLLIYGVMTTHFAVRRSKSAQEKAAAFRVSAFAWIAGATLVGAFLFLPNKHRVLMLAPMLLGAVTIAKVWQSTRARIRREQEEIVDLERMKRAN
jgi:hypothetical protein